jgi:hypothetical protein
LNLENLYWNIAPVVALSSSLLYVHHTVNGDNDDLREIYSHGRDQDYLCSKRIIGTPCVFLSTFQAAPLVVAGAISRKIAQLAYPKDTKDSQDFIDAR